MLKGPENGKLLKAEKTDRLPTREVAQTPDVEPVCQRSPIVLPQGVNVSEHADDGRGYSRLVVAEKTAKDEVHCPLAISQLGRRLIPIPPRNIRQIANPQGRKPNAIYGIRIINTQNLQGLGARYRLTRGSPTPKADAQNGTPVYRKHPHLTGAKMEGPRVMEEPLHPTPHQGVPHLHIGDAEKGAKAQLYQEVAILPTRDRQKPAKIRPPTLADTLRRILQNQKEECQCEKS
jgi:hypothetical protein